MFRNVRNRLASLRVSGVFKWSRRKNSEDYLDEPYETENSVKITLSFAAFGVFVAMIIGGVIGWFGASLYHSEPKTVVAYGHDLTPNQFTPEKSECADTPSNEISSSGSSSLIQKTTKTVDSSYQDFEQLSDITSTSHQNNLDKKPFHKMGVNTEEASVADALIQSTKTPVPESSLKSHVVLPTWLKNSLPFHPDPKKPMIAIIIDDMGLDQRRTLRVAALQGPLTGSFLSYSQNLQKQADTAFKAGMELMLHMPMEPFGRNYDPGPGVLLVSMSDSVIQKRLRKSLASFNGYIGINNHMGSRFTSCQKCMRAVVEVLKEKDLAFIDSLTTGKSVAAKTAEAMKVPTLTRDVFIDDNAEITDIRIQLKRIERVALKQGTAVAIGHPRDTTLQALKEWLPTLKSKGFQLVPASTLLKVKYGKLP